MRVRSIPLGGETVRWDTTNLAEAQQVAGDRFAGVRDTLLLVLGPEPSAGEERTTHHVLPGWSVIRWDGEDDLTVLSDGMPPWLEADPEPAADAA